MDFPGTTRHTAPVPRNVPPRPRTLDLVTLVAATLLSGLHAEDSWTFVDLSSRLHGPRAADPAAKPRDDYGPLWGDFDGDGWIDLVFMNHGDPPSLYRNREGIELVDRFEQSGLRRDGWPYPQGEDRHGGACADFDNDGDLDLFVSHGAKRGETLGIKSDELLANRGDGTFVDVASEAGARNTMGRARTPVWLDYDGDGRLDLLIGNYISPNVLLHNLGDGTFADVTEELGVGEVDSHHPAWADLDLDRDPDLLSVAPVDLRTNDGGRAFPRAPSAGSAGYPAVESALGVAWGDFDGDGLIDAFVSSGTATAADSRLFGNESGTFRARPVDLGMVGREGTSGAAAGDLDNDGDVDLVVLGRRQVRLLVNAGDGVFTAQRLAAPGLEPGYEGDVALADLDRDGFLDLAINAVDGQHLYGNRQRGGGWLELRLRGSRANADGLGALVDVATPGKPTLHRQHLGDTGFYKSTSCAPLHVGVGDRTVLDVTVAWPGGATQRIRGLPPSKTVVLRESPR